MIKLFSVKEKQKKDAEAAASGKAIKQTAGELRLQKDMSEIDLPKGVSIRFPDGNDKIMNFEIVLKPDEGLYKNGSFLFSFAVPNAYPHEPPKVKCLTKVYHPNIDLEGNVCLNILREDWKPVLTITSIVYGLNFLFLAPNPDDPLNKEAAQAMQSNPSQFERNVAASISRGCTVGSEYFPAARGDRTQLVAPLTFSFPLLDMSTDELVELFAARQRRRFQRGLNRKCLGLVKKLRKAKKAAEGTGEKPEPVRTHLRNMVIIPEMIGSVLGVYNGKTFNQVEIKPDMIGHYLAEFSISYKPVSHGKAGIGSTNSSRFIPLK
ncbi:hypothetical protein Ndes2526A_g05133 [Nannochloris sp. 'desiccata']